MVAAAVAQSQAFVAGKVAARPRAQRAAPVAAMQQSEAAPAAPLRFLAAGLAAAALAAAPAPAEAGVVLVQPEVKNFVRDSPVSAKPAAAKKAAPAAKKERKEESGAPGAGFEAFRPLVLPLSLVGVVGAGAAATKADPEFAELLRGEWSAKDSNIVGVGYETAPGLKDTPFFGGSNTNGAQPKKAGSQKAKAGSQKVKAGSQKVKAGTAKKSVLGSIFGSRD